MSELQQLLRAWLESIAVALAFLLAAKLLIRRVSGLAARLPEHAHFRVSRPALAHLEHPVVATLTVLLMIVATGWSPLPRDARQALRHDLGLVVVVCLAWIAVAMADGLVDTLGRRYRIDVADNLSARRMHTRLRILRHIYVMAVVCGATAVILMTIPPIRALGSGLLASAGVAGLVVGMAARPLLGNLIAGVQMAFTEPISLDDVVVLDGQFGRVEEIRSTFVVLRLWDLRRLIVPLSHFLEHPVENWTRTSSALLGTVTLPVDYATPVEALREEATRLVQASPLWDGRAVAVQVTEAREWGMEVRVLLSAANADHSWELRCEVREKLIRWLRQNYPACLPMVRRQYGLAMSRPEPEPAAAGRS